MKRLIALFLALMLLLSTAAVAEEALSGNAKVMYDAILWDVNLPKTANILRADEYLVKLSSSVTLKALILKVTMSDLQENMYGNSAGIMVIDLDDGTVIDRFTVDDNVMWPDEITDKTLALNLLFNCYDAFTQGYNPFVMSEFEFLTPIADEEIASVNAALNAHFLPQE